MENRFMFEDGQNPFEILGLEPTFDLNLSVLDKAYFSRQSLTHPDRFVYHSEPERQAASKQSSSLNWAYESLKNPTLRAKVLLKLRGIDVGGEDGKTVQNPKILAEMLDLQETINQASSPSEINDIESKIQNRFQDVIASFSKSLHPNGNSELIELYLSMTYLSKLLSDVKHRQCQSSVKWL